jgi:hypothetical protein
MQSYLIPILSARLSLSCAVPNHTVSACLNLSICPSAGDVLDSILDPVVLRHFVNLHHLVITSSMYWRMTR